MATSTYTVQGMTCGHCRASVIEEVSEVAGVEQVEVVLADGSLTVRGDGFEDAAVRTAVDEAGYTVTP